VLGKEHPRTLTSANNLAVVLQTRGDYKAAQKHLRRALKGREKVLGKEHSDALSSVWCFAELMECLGHKAETCCGRLEHLSRCATSAYTTVSGLVGKTSKTKGGLSIMVANYLGSSDQTGYCLGRLSILQPLVTVRVCLRSPFHEHVRG
jgi:hypothetical protein